MSRGRPQRGLSSIDLLEGPSEEKKRLKAILEKLSGKITADEACAVLGIGRAYYYVLENEVLHGALMAIMPRPIGRPPELKPGEPPEVSALKEEVRELGLALEASRTREELWATMPDVARRVLGGPKKRATENR